MAKKTQKEPEIDLPTSEEAFESLIDRLMDRFKLPNRDHAVVVTANTIMHMPIDQATTTLKYLGGCVRKRIAYEVARAKGSQTAHRTQIDEIVSCLTSDPLNQQARDELEKQALAGSPYAKEKCDLLGFTITKKPEETPKETIQDEVH